jgi:peptidoglycan/LPS O-acetylase OafA/YrhL
MPQLDGLRAVAIALVLYAHLTPHSLWLLNIDWGAWGVRLFFVLSGFLITGILLDCRRHIHSPNDAPRPRGRLRHVLRAFYARRALRILPVFYVTLLVAAMLHVPAVRKTLPWHLAYLSNVYFGIKGDWFGYVGAYWSLAVEEQFYLVWPFVVLLVPRRGLLPAVIGLIALAPASRALMLAFHANNAMLYGSTLSALDTLGFGALLALMKHPEGAVDPRVVRRVIALSPLALVGMVALLAINRGSYHAWITGISQNLLLGTSFLWIVNFAAEGDAGIVGRFLESPPIAYLGRISYGVYVLHLIVLYLVDRALHHLLIPSFWQQPYAWFVLSLFTVLTTLLLAQISWHRMERPINRLKHRFHYAPPTLAVSSASA